MSIAERFLVKPGAGVSLANHDPASTEGFPASSDPKADAERLTRAQVERIAALQEDLYAENTRSLLVVLQGMDTSGKDGVIRHVFSGVNPQGVRVVSFEQPSTLELEHDFLWRVHLHCPQRGEIGVFNRSHYESVIVERVHAMIDAQACRARYGFINDFERLLTCVGAYTPPTDGGGCRPTRGRAACAILKFFLHISKDEQLRRLKARIGNPRKNWKVEPGDFEERKRWPEYMRAYEDALGECSTEHAPWFVIPSDQKWFQRWAVSEIVRDTLERMRPAPPRSKYDLTKIKAE